MKLHDKKYVWVLILLIFLVVVFTYCEHADTDITGMKSTSKIILQSATSVHVGDCKIKILVIFTIFNCVNAVLPGTYIKDCIEELSKMIT